MRIFNILTMAAACAAAAALSGCYRHAYDVGTGADPEAKPQYSQWQNHFLWGLVGDPKVDISHECASGNATVKEKTSFVNGLVGGLTFGIYGPTTVDVICAGGSGRSAAAGTGSNDTIATVRLNPVQMRAIALDPRTIEWVSTFDADKARELEGAVRSYNAMKTHPHIAARTAAARL